MTERLKTSWKRPGKPLQDQKEAQTVRKKGQEVSAPRDRMIVHLAQTRTRRVGKDAVRRHDPERVVKRLKETGIRIEHQDHEIATITLNQEVVHDQAVVRQAVRENVVRAPGVEKKDQKTISACGKGHLPLEGLAQEKHRKPRWLARSIQNERREQNEAQLQGTLVRIDHGLRVMRVRQVRLGRGQDRNSKRVVWRKKPVMMASFG